MPSGLISTGDGLSAGPCGQPDYVSVTGILLDA
jgi:hypothetical protein